MKTGTRFLALVIFLAAGTVCFASPQMGTWKLNEKKSKLIHGATKNKAVVYESVGDKVKVTVDGVDRKGNPTHNEWAGLFDGKDYPVTGDPDSDMRSYSKIDNRTLAITVKKDGNVVWTGRISVTADGKSRTVALSGTNAKGRKIKSTAVYDKQ